MKLTRIKVQNFRCIDAAEIFPTKFLSLIGPNNAGKSAMLRAIEVLLTAATPAADEWRKGHETEPIVIEADFEDIQEWERRKPGVASLVFENRIRIRMTFAGATDDADGERNKRPRIESYRRLEEIVGWPETEAYGDLPEEMQLIAQAENINPRAFRANAAKERLRQAIRDRAPHLVVDGPPTWTAEGTSIAAALQQALPQVQMIPAVRDASEEGAFGPKTSFGMLVKSILIPALKGAEEYRDFIAAAGSLRGKLSGTEGEQLPEIRALGEELTRRISTLIAAKTNFDLAPPDAEKFLGTNATLNLDDGTQTRIGLQGHGLQRALVFAMLEILATQRRRVGEGAEAADRTVVLLFEEPELFIHPHLLRRLKRSLVQISEQAGWQVILTTHSPFMVDVASDPRALVIHRRATPGAPPTVLQLKRDIFADLARQSERERLRAALDFHPGVCEAFFAERAVLVEGDTEVAALVSQPQLYELLEIDQAEVDRTTIVSCEGKWTIVPIARILIELRIPVRIIHDLDRRARTTDHPANAAIAALNSNDGLVEIFPVDDTFEDLLWGADERPQGSKDKPFRAWKRVKALCQAGTIAQDAPAFASLVQFAFRREREVLRRVGAG